MPTPTIVQAAQALYEGHEVADITRSDAGVFNLTTTKNTLAEIIDQSRQQRQKSICFVTGVPGSGKTLVGLDIATDRQQEHAEEHAVFLSGNGPLVTVLQEALARDQAKREGVTKKVALQKTKQFIQNIHHFRDDSLVTDGAPIEQVVIYDEAQRAWNKDKASRFMRQKKGVQDFAQSEPEFLVEVMDRHEDWCVIVALIGGGQEINDGEAGLAEWFTSLRRRFAHWRVYYSNVMDSDEYIAGGELQDQVAGLNALDRSGLHLNVSVRSFRADKLSRFVHELISNKPSAARKQAREILDVYPIVITRDINLARSWLKQQARGSELFGLVASSGGRRLKPYGVDVKSKASPAEWFLNGRYDVRACQYLEVVATEFDIQGLELDWVGLCWDANLRYVDGQWTHHSFKGTKWTKINNEQNRQYLLNAYRVLMTRARQGVVIFLPEGYPHDHTRPPEFYDGTYEYLRSCGVEDLAFEQNQPLSETLALKVAESAPSYGLISQRDLDWN